MWGTILTVFAVCFVLTLVLLAVEVVRAERHGLGADQARFASQRERKS